MNLAFNKQGAKGLTWLLCIVVAIELAACVTINIYFPAAAAEKAADKVIDEIWQIPAGQSPSKEQNVVPATTAPASVAPKE